MNQIGGGNGERLFDGTRQRLRQRRRLESPGLIRGKLLRNSPLSTNSCPIHFGHDQSGCIALRKDTERHPKP